MHKGIPNTLFVDDKSANSEGKTLLAKVNAYAEKVKPLVEHCDSEEQTKISFINPMIEILGHDVRDPRQVRLEYTVDLRLNKEKVDYAILDQEGIARIFIEAKPMDSNLGVDRKLNQIRSYANQLPEVRFIVLTNGRMWQWFKKDDHRYGGSQLNVTPFLTHDVLAPTLNEMPFLIKISGRNMDITHAEKQADENKLAGSIEGWIRKQMNPSTVDEEFVKVLARNFLNSAAQRNVQRVKYAWCDSFRQFIERQIDERLEDAKEIRHGSTTNRPIDVPEVLPDNSDDGNQTNGNKILKNILKPRPWISIRPKSTKQAKVFKDVSVKEAVDSVVLAEDYGTWKWEMRIHKWMEFSYDGTEITTRPLKEEREQGVGDVRTFNTEQGVISLNVKGLKRAWKPKESSLWKVEKNASELFVHIVQYFASLDTRGRDAYYDKLALSYPRIVRQTHSPSTKEKILYSHMAGKIALYCNLNNNDKSNYLRKFASLMQGSGRDGAQLDDIVDLWLDDNLQSSVESNAT